jgi:hypothetical protein
VPGHGIRHDLGKRPYEDLVVKGMPFGRGVVNLLTSVSGLNIEGAVGKIAFALAISFSYHHLSASAHEAFAHRALNGPAIRQN